MVPPCKDIIAHPATGSSDRPGRSDLNFRSCWRPAIRRTASSIGFAPFPLFGTSQRKGAMNKRQLIEEIRKHNITAQAGFLAQFDEDALGNISSTSKKPARSASASTCPSTLTPTCAW